MRPPPKILLHEWARRKWDPPPSVRTLERWVHNANIQPQPEKVGRRLYVDPDAKYIDNNGNVEGSRQIDDEAVSRWLLRDLVEIDTLSEEKLRRLPRKKVYGSGVYFLWSESKLQYVGQSQSVLKRIKDHSKRGLIPFDSHTILPVEPLEVTTIERAYIKRYSPPFNRAGKRETQ